jgi:hypothetical protein
MVATRSRSSTPRGEEEEEEEGGGGGGRRVRFQPLTTTVSTDPGGPSWLR